MSDRDFLWGPVAPGLYKLDEKTLVSVRMARSAQDPSRYRAVALAVLRDNHKMALSATLTAGYGTDREAALNSCLEKVREGLEKRRTATVNRSGRRPEASL